MPKSFPFQRKNLGLALIYEVLGFMAFLAVLTGAFLMLYKAYTKQSKVVQTKEEIERIFQFFRMTYVSNLKFAKNGCIGFENCPYTLTPEPITDTTFRVHLGDVSLLNVLKGYCSVENTGENQYDVTCYSAYSGEPLEFKIENYHEYQKPFLAPYEGKYTSITITEPTLGFSATLVLNNEINKSLLDTAEILRSLKQAIEAWARRRLELAIGNACGDTSTSPTDPEGGLGSWDDVLIPWVWQAFGYSPFTFTPQGVIPTLCQGIDGGCQCGSNCGCTNFLNDPNVWRADLNLCKVYDVEEWGRFLDHLGLSITYATDGFGNLLTFVPLSNAEGEPSNCPPPPPSCCYPYDVPKKGTIGIYDHENGRWLYRVETIYP